MKYAIISLMGHQYKVEEGDELLVDKMEKDSKEPEVLLYVSDKTVKVGMPGVKGAKVEFERLGDEKGDKLHVQKFRAKSRYRRKIGFRPQYSKIKISKITA